MKCFTEIYGVSIVLQLTMQVLHWKYEAVYVFLVLTMHFLSSLTATLIISKHLFMIWEPHMTRQLLILNNQT